MEKRKPGRSATGLVVGIVIILDMLRICFNLRNAGTNDEALDYLVWVIGYNILKTPIILGFLAGVASIIAYAAHFKWAHLIGFGFIVLAIITLPAYISPTTFYIWGGLAFLSFLDDCWVEAKEKRQVDDVLNGIRPLYNYKTKSYENMQFNDGLPEHELRLLKYYRALDEEGQLRVRKFAKKLTQKEN